MKWLTNWRLNSMRKKIDVLYKFRQKNTVSDSEIAKEAALHKKLIAFYQKRRFSKHCPESAIYIQEGYRAAANLNDIESQYLLGKHFFERGNFWLTVQKSFYGANIHEEYAKTCFNEAYAYMMAAEEQGHILAKRLHGLALIHGWGHEKNEEKGFKLIVDSIKQAGAWDKATEIFKELNLNNSQFFEYIMSSKEQA